MLEVRNISFKKGEHIILNDLSFSIKKGEYVGLIGPNGAGKTTLIKLIIGFYKPTGGSIVLSDDMRIGYVPQNYTLSNVVPIAVREVLAMAGVGNTTFFTTQLEKVGLDKSFLQKNFHRLSGGQKQRVIIARALCQEPNFLIFDEPLNGVDIATQRKVYDLLADLNKNKNLAILLVSHDVEQVVAESGRIVCLNKSIHHGCHPLKFLHNHHATCPIDDAQRTAVPIHHHHNRQ